MRELISLFRELIGKRKLVTELAKADFRKRFVGSYFGIVWMFIQPMVTIAIYAFIFGEHGMKNAPPVPGATYVIWLTPGIIPWFYFSEILNTGTNCLQEYHYLVKKVVFQVEMLPVIKLISCFLVHACFLIIMAGLYLIDGRMPSATWIQVLYYSFAASMLGLALTYFTSAVPPAPAPRTACSDRRHLSPVRHVADPDHVRRGNLHQPCILAGVGIQA